MCGKRSEKELGLRWEIRVWWRGGQKKAWEEMDQVSISASQFSALTSPKIGMLASGQFSLSLPFFSSSAMALSTPL